MNIRIANIGEIDGIMDVYAAARQFMRTTGNENQWIGGYPSRELLLKDIRNKDLYVCISDKNMILGVFYFKVEEDKTYINIYEGQWLNDKPYGVVHRIASNGKQKGIADFCLRWCLEQCNNIRIDTHRDNIVMQNILKKNNYTQCGIIYIADGSERIAFQKTL